MEIANKQLDPMKLTVITTKPTLHTNQEKKHINASNAKEISIDGKGDTFKFTTSFACLGSALFFLLDNASDVKYRMSKAFKAIGALSNAYNAKEILLSLKVKLHKAISINSLL